MSTARTRLALAISATAIAALALAGCASNDPLSGDDGATEQSGESSAIVIGSQAYYSNEIIAEIYAQALEGAGFQVERNFNIGQRDAYMPSLEDGSIDLFPEYTGSINSFLDKNSTATSPDDVYAALGKALPANLVALDKAEAQDSDAVVVTQETADKYKLKTIADLAKKN
jgi:osmoprotectant transport system substrate-binding protein